MADRRIEQRCFQGLEVREADKELREKSGNAGTVTGYAAVFNSWSEQLGWFREKIRPGAFAESLKRGDDVRALVNHESNLLIGRRSAKTLRLAEDERGLKVEIDIPDTTVGRDTIVSMKRGDMTGMSFAFDVINDEWQQRTEGGKRVYERELITVDLFDVSVVTFPAYSAASAEARSMIEHVAKEGIAKLGGGPSLRSKLIADWRKLTM